MDYKLDNENLGLLEKNKKLFADFSKDKADPNFDEPQDKDTFKMYENFMKEKESIIEVVNELVNFACGLCGVVSSQPVTGKINKLEEMINFKNRIIMILENYQEQPGLLDPILGLIVPALMNNSIILIEYILKTNSSFTSPVYTSIQCLYQIVYILCKIRGYQTITKFFSSEVHIFEPVINFLLQCNPEDSENWYLIYVLILWTSILGLVPFDVDTIDTHGIIISNITDYYKKTLTLSGNLRDISAYSLSKFITRPDIIEKGLLDSFISYCVQTLQNENLNMNHFINIGLLSALCEIFKNGLPKDLFKYVDYLSNSIIKFNFPNHVKNSGVFKRFLCKLIQRIGLVMLKPKFQNWRYKLSLKTLKEDVYEQEEDSVPKGENLDEEDNEQLDYEIDFSTLETLIDQLLNSLNDKEYIVRWSAAKGVGRLCERLTKQMVDDIFQSLENLFEDEENEYSWQGACLCIAELCKRGMILPDKIGELISYLEKALIFEVNKGTFCSGSIVRDSACYVVWALARAYSRDVMKPYVERLAKSLILTILFDKEVNCRRAASAAFQEHVGRQGFFPHGIEIITEADYFTLGKKIYCYLNISTFIAQYDEYFESMVNYLSFNRLIHVEQSIRQVSAEALGLLVPFNPEFFVNKILKKLLEYCYSKTLFVRHGAILGLGYILVGLKGKWDFESKARRIQKKILDGLNQSEKKILEDSNYRTSFEEKYEKIKYLDQINLLNANFIAEILKIPHTLDKLNLYRGKGAEIMRTAVNNLIRLICESTISIDESSFVYYVDVLLDNIKHPNQDIQKEACESLKLLNSSSRMINGSSNLQKEIERRFKSAINLSVNDDNIYANKGFTMSIPYFESKLILNNYPDVLNSLYTNSKLKSKNNDAEVRKFALESLSHVACRFINEYVK
jgi:hypothetical protein